MVFDYVIVGGGSAGSVLARRLTDDRSVKVCLIEAGGDNISNVSQVSYHPVRNGDKCRDFGMSCQVDV